MRVETCGCAEGFATDGYIINCCGGYMIKCRDGYIINCHGDGLIKYGCDYVIVQCTSYSTRVVDYNGNMMEKMLNI